MASERRTGLTVPAGILQPTTRPEPDPPAVEPEEPGGAPQAADDQGEPKAPRAGRRKRIDPAGQGGKVEGRRLYLSESTHFRLRMLAYQRGKKLSEVAEEVLDKALPRWNVERTG